MTKVYIYLFLEVLALLQLSRETVHQEAFCVGLGHNGISQQLQDHVLCGRGTFSDITEVYYEFLLIILTYVGHQFSFFHLFRQQLSSGRFRLYFCSKQITG